MFIRVKDVRLNINTGFWYKPDGNYRISFKGDLVYFPTKAIRDAELARIDDLLERGLYFISENRP